MTELCYNAYSIAHFIVSQDLSIRRQMGLFDWLYEEEIDYIHPYFRYQRKRFITDILYWVNYLMDKDDLDAEFPAVKRDLEAIGKHFNRESGVSEFADFDLFFSTMRLRILFLSKKDYERMKLRTLLHQYGYKRRSPQLLSHIEKCMAFYHIQSSLKDNQECSIQDVDIDDMITFRII